MAPTVEPGGASSAGDRSPGAGAGRCWFCGDGAADAGAAYPVTLHRRPAAPGAPDGGAPGADSTTDSDPSTGTDPTTDSDSTTDSDTAATGAGAATETVAVPRCRRCHARQRRAWLGYLFPVGTAVAIPVVLLSGVGLVLPVLVWLALFTLFGMRDDGHAPHEVAATHPAVATRLGDGWHLPGRH